MKKSICIVVILLVVVAPLKSHAKAYSKETLGLLVDMVLDDIEMGGIVFDKANYRRLLMETAAVETDLGRLDRNTHKHSDRGLFQINKFTYKDIKKNYLFPTTKSAERQHLIALLESNKDFTLTPDRNLRHNDYYNCVLAFTVYYRAIRHRNIKKFSNVWTRAWLWKKYYNTSLGSGKIKDYIKKRKRYLIDG